MVLAAVVVIAQVGGELAAQAAVADVDEASKRWSPTLFEDGAVQPFDVAVALRAPSADLGVSDAGGQAGVEGAAAELGAVVGT